MSITNIYLKRLGRMPDSPFISGPAKALRSGLQFSDRLLGTSAGKMRTRANIISDLVKTHGGAPGMEKVKGLSTSLNHRAATLTQQSRNTRIKTGLALGGSAIAYKAFKNYKENTAAIDGYGYPESAYYAN